VIFKNRFRQKTSRMTKIARILIGSAALSFGLLSKSLPPIVLGLVLAKMIVVLNVGVMVFW